MKIIRLASANVKRLSAVEITPAGALVTVGGKNGTGKSSVLDSIAYALGGDKLVPTEPIRAGQSEAKIVVDLGDYIVTRKFNRERVHASDCPTNVAPADHIACNCQPSWTATRSTLAVTNREGAKYPSPQALLDKLYGKLTFDPLAFSREKADKQNEILRRIVGLDFSELNELRKATSDVRAMMKRAKVIAEANLTGLSTHAGLPPDEVLITTVTEEIGRDRTTEQHMRAAEQTLSTRKAQQDSIALRRDRQVNMVAALKRQVEEEEAELKKCVVLLDAKAAEVLADEKIVADLRALLPDFNELDKKLAAVDATNRKIRENKMHAVQQAEIARLDKGILEHDATIDGVDQTKERALRSAKFPVFGLGLTDDGVTFEGLPLDQVSSAVQLRVSIAIGLALNPTLKVLLIRNGNLLDDDGLKLVAEQAAEAGAQVWMEYVTSDSGDVSVMLEDGHLA